MAKDLESHYRVTAIGSVVEELIKHLKIVGMFTINFEIRVLVMFPHSFNPVWVIELTRHFIENLFFFQGTFSVLVFTFLDFQRVKFLVAKFKSEPDC